MTDITALQAGLTRHAGELDAIAKELASMIPESCTRDDLILLASNDAYAAKWCAISGANRIAWAIQREMGGSDGQD